MNWYKLMKNISLVGGICSVIITIVGFVLILHVFKSDRYTGKTVKETPLEKYVKVLYIGVILNVVFQIILFALRLFNKI
jgi:F0F1-type ATP synthase assembly protein I